MHKQVTPEQLEIWLHDPVTQSYLDCLQYCLGKTKEALTEGRFIDPANTSLTQYNAAVLKSRKDTLIEFADPAVTLALYEKAEVDNA